MLIQFQPTGQIVNLDNLTPVPVEAGQNPSFSAVRRQFGGPLPSGNFNFFTAAPGVAGMYWKTNSNAVNTIWQMDDNAALETLMATINTQIAANEGFIIVGSDGALYTGS